MGDEGIWWGRSIEGGNDTGADASADADGSADGGSEGHAISDAESTKRIDVNADANAAQDEELDESVLAEPGDRWQEAAAEVRQRTKPSISSTAERRRTTSPVTRQSGPTPTRGAEDMSMEAERLVHAGRDWRIWRSRGCHTNARLRGQAAHIPWAPV